MKLTPMAVCLHPHLAGPGARQIVILVFQNFGAAGFLETDGFDGILEVSSVQLRFWRKKVALRTLARSALALS